jgi:hypothetical protein
MYTGQIAAISNKATWQSEVYELVDDQDGSTTDLTNTDLALDIVVTVKEISACGYGCVLATASISNGKVSVPGPGFRWQFEVSDLSGLAPAPMGLARKSPSTDLSPI